MKRRVSKKIVLSLSALAFTLSFFAQNQDQNSFSMKTILYTPSYIAFDDINGDNIPDMVGVNGSTNTNIEIYFGNGDRTFTLDTVLDGKSGLEYYKVMLEDFNEDNIPDIVAVSGISGILFMSDHEGNFKEVTMPTASSSFGTEATIIGDFNEDGSSDLIFNRRIFLNNKDGSFTLVEGNAPGNSGLLADGTIPGNGDIKTLYFNEDNHLDLVIADPANGYINFYEGNGDGTFQKSSKELSSSVSGIESFDLDKDGLSDFIAKSNDGKFYIYYNDQSQDFTKSDTLDLGHTF